MPDFSAARIQMVDCQIRPSDVTRYPIIEAMLAIPREQYVPSALRSVAYAGAHVELGDGRVVLDPRVFGKMLDELALSSSDLVLDIGCALGYSTAVLAHVAEAVIAIESDAQMAGEAATTLAEQGVDNAVATEGVLTEGDPAHGPYDVIMIQGGVEEMPQALLDQLKPGGRIAAIFMDGGAGQARIGIKTGNGIAWRHAFDATAPVLNGFERAPAFQF